jgi:hypothetical protein
MGVRAESDRVVGTSDTSTSFSQRVVFFYAGASHSETGESIAQEDFIPAAISPFSCLP